MPWLNWSVTVVECVRELTRRLTVEEEAAFVLTKGYPLGWRVYGVRRAITQLTALGFKAWVTDSDVVHARRVERQPDMSRAQ